jgi:hypothetical protein
MLHLRLMDATVDERMREEGPELSPKIQDRHLFMPLFFR